jgi:acyl carrier protein
MNENTVGSEIIAYLTGQTGLDAALVTRETDLFREGLLDSMGLVEVIAFCEQEFDVTFELADLTEENVASVGALARLVVQHRK